MKIAGWTLSSNPATPLGPSAMWTKTVSGNVVGPMAREGGVGCGAELVLRCVLAV
jgi:IMP dehydrogenase/GMP reductase